MSPFILTQARISISIRQSPHQQQSAVRQTRPQSDVASVVLSNVSQTNSKRSSSTTCWEFCRRFLSAVTLKLIQIFLSKYDRLRTDPFLRLIASAASSCYGVSLGWYPVLSKVLSCKYKHLRHFVDILYKKIIDIGQYLFKLFQKICRGPFFSNHSVDVLWCRFCRFKRISFDPNCSHYYNTQVMVWDRHGLEASTCPALCCKENSSIFKNKGTFLWNCVFQTLHGFRKFRQGTSIFAMC